MERASGYVRVELSMSDAESCVSAAEFHVRSGGDGEPRLVGVVH